MGDDTAMDKRYTDQVRVHIEARGDGLGAPATDEWFVTIDTGAVVDRAYFRDSLVAALDAPNYRLEEQHNNPTGEQQEPPSTCSCRLLAVLAERSLQPT